MEKPEATTEKYLKFLDGLRKSGITNMFGAAPYIQETFPELSKTQAKEILAYWMKTFSERHKES